MGIISGIVVYILIWWVVIFTMLPLWVKRDESGPDVTAHGAPEDPKLKRKFVLTTLVSIVVWCIVYLLIEGDIINFREIAEKMSEQDYN